MALSNLWIIFGTTKCVLFVGKYYFFHSYNYHTTDISDSIKMII